VNSKITEVEKWLAENDTRSELDVDAAVAAKDVWSRQALDAHANDAAIDDVLYALDEALKEGTLDLPTYLKYVRKFATTQFKHRALILKIAQRQATLGNQQPPQRMSGMSQFI